MRLRVFVLAALSAVSMFVAIPVQAAAACRSGNPLANVYAPHRLKVLAPCRTVSGTVASVVGEHDGDIHLYLKVDPQYEWMINSANRRYHNSTLVLEIVSADQPGCIKGHKVKDGICTGAHIRTPKVGAHITATGPFVRDNGHAGWNEIHPVWQLTT